MKQPRIRQRIFPGVRYLFSSMGRLGVDAEVGLTRDMEWRTHES